MCAAQHRLHSNDNNTPNICNLQEAGGQEHSEHGESVRPTIKAESAAIFTQHLTGYKEKDSPAFQLPFAGRRREFFRALHVSSK